MQQPIIKAKKLDPRALLPHRAHATDSGADLFALERTVLPAHTVVKVRTGIAVELPENTSGIIWGKSSVESKGIKAMAGLVDAPYRGELLVCIISSCIGAFLCCPHNLGRFRLPDRLFRFRN